MKLNSMHKTALAIVLMSACLALASPAAAAVVVVTNPAVPGDAVSASNLQKYYLGKSTSWSDGTSVKPAMLVGGPTTDEFLKSYVKKSSSQFKTFWKKAVFSGTGTPPEEFGSDADVIKYVAATPGAVGYVAEGSDTAGTKVLTVQ